MTTTTPRAPGRLRRWLIEFPSRLLVGAITLAHRRRLVTSAIGLALTLVLGVTYMVFGALGFNPADSTIIVRVQLTDSGGLLPDRNVALRGVPIGHVRSIDLTPDGLVAVAVLDARTRIPQAGHASVKSLSMAGEQYLDFESETDEGPYLTDGAYIPADRTSSPVPLWQTLAHLDPTLAQIDPARLASIVDELGVGPEGPQKLRSIIDGGIFLVSTLHSVLPQTVQLLRDSGTVLDTVGASGPGLRRVASNADSFLQGAEAMNGGFGTLVDTTPGLLGSMDAVLADNAPTMVQLLGNLTTVAQMAYVRIPAFQEFFFPQGRPGSTLRPLADEAIRDGGIWGIVNLYPRRTCDFDHPRSQPSRPDLPLPYLYTNCPDNDPSLLIRGARNAPRPPGERDPAVAAPGHEQDRASPPPIGPESLPLPYGGPDLSHAPPAPGTAPDAPPR